MFLHQVLILSDLDPVALFLSDQKVHEKASGPLLRIQPHYRDSLIEFDLALALELPFEFSDRLLVFALVNDL